MVSDKRCEAHIISSINVTAYGWLALAIGSKNKRNMDHTDFKGARYNLLNGQFLKGNEPYTKGKKWSEWMPKHKQRKIRKNLDKVRPKGGNPNLGGQNKRKVVCLTDEGEWLMTYNSAASAAAALSLNRRNICHCCQGKRKHCGEYRWFYFDDDSWAKFVKRD
jgi:hypothetical protein